MLVYTLYILELSFGIHNTLLKQSKDHIFEPNKMYS